MSKNKNDNAMPNFDQYKATRKERIIRTRPFISNDKSLSTFINTTFLTWETAENDVRSMSDCHSLSNFTIKILYTAEENRTIRISNMAGIIYPPHYKLQPFMASLHQLKASPIATICADSGKGF